MSSWDSYISLDLEIQEGTVTQRSRKKICEIIIYNIWPDHFLMQGREYFETFALQFIIGTGCDETGD